MKLKHRTEHQRWAYAMRRASQGVDRIVVAQALPEKLKASCWAEAWALSPASERPATDRPVWLIDPGYAAFADAATTALQAGGAVYAAGMTNPSRITKHGQELHFAKRVVMKLVLPSEHDLLAVIDAVKLTARHIVDRNEQPILTNDGGWQVVSDQLGLLWKATAVTP